MRFSTKTKALNYGMEFTHGVRRALVGALMLVYLISLGFNVVAVTTLFAISTLIIFSNAQFFFEGLFYDLL